MLQLRIDREARLRLLGDLVHRHAGREFDQRHAAVLAVDVEHTEIGDHHVDHAGAGERQVALVQELGLVLGSVLHHHHHLLDAGDQVHGTAHALHHLAVDHPIGEIAVLRHLHGAEDCDVDTVSYTHLRAHETDSYLVCR